METVSIQKDIPVVGQYDVVVCGGGPAGLIAAVAAARNGANTLLIERYGFVGGMATNALVTPVCDFRRNGRPVIGGIPLELMESANRLGGADMRPSSGYLPINDELFKLAAQRLLLESGATRLYHTFFSDCALADGRVTHVVVQNKAGRCAYAARFFIDCTGDADLVRAVGYPVIKHGALQPASLWFQLGGVDTSAHRILSDDRLSDDYMPWPAYVHEKLTKLYQRGEMPLFGGPWISRFFHDGVVTINMLREDTDASSPERFTRTECNMREHLHRVIEVLRAHFPEFKDCWLMKSGVQTGVRETFHIASLYQMTADDVLNIKAFPDTVAKGAHIIDIHRADSPDIELLFPKREYNIPYRSFVPVGSRNLITAGRSIGADRTAFGTLRVMATCMAMGQGAGTAAALAAEAGSDAAEVDVRKLRAVLKEQGALIDLGTVS